MFSASVVNLSTNFYCQVVSFTVLLSRFFFPIITNVKLPSPTFDEGPHLPYNNTIYYTCLNCLPEARSAEGEQFRQVYYDYIRT